MPLDTPIPTPTGWTTFGEISVGDSLFDEQGKVCSVDTVWDVVENPELYRFDFDDGSSIVSCIDHQWLTFDSGELSALTRRDPAWRDSRRACRRSRAGSNKSEIFRAAISARNSRNRPETLPAPTGTVRTTREIVSTIKSKAGRANHAIPVAGVLDLEPANLPLDPYVLGVWLGDGSSGSGAITGLDEDIFSEIESAGFKLTKYAGKETRGVPGLRTILRRIGVFRNKHVPMEYLRASRDQRIALLQGLMDTDGTVAKGSGAAEFCNTNKRLADAVVELANSLGWKAFAREGRAKLNGRDCGPKWTIKFVPGEYVFRLPRKRCIQKLASRRTTRFRYIIGAERVNSAPGRCIAVTSPSKLFLAGRHMVPTHNSAGIRMDMILACLQNPGLQAYLFRKTLPEIDDNHVNPVKSLLIPPEIAEFQETRKTLFFKNGSFLRFCFSEDDATIHKFQGAEIHFLGVDEAALMTPYQLRFLISRVRLGGWTPAQDGYFPRIVFTSNPGGPSHSYLKRKFIDAAPPLTYFFDKSTASKANTQGWKSIFIPAKMADNPHLDRSMYEGAFTGMAPEQARALRDGDWDAVAGAALFNLNREKHMLRPFTPPRHWTHFSAIDWGTYKPFSIGWYVVSEGAIIEDKDGWKERWIPPGAIIRFAEWYGWNGEPDSGCRLESPSVARRWLQMEDEMGLPAMDFRVGDSQMWAQMDGPSVVQRMRDATDGRISLRQGRRDRRANYAEFISRLGDIEHSNGMIAPMFYVTQNCEHFWRTCPGLLLDQNEPDKGPATRHQEDHPYDEATFAMSQQPMITTKRQRDEMDFETKLERYGVNRSGDPYAT